MGSLKYLFLSILLLTTTLYSKEEPINFAAGVESRIFMSGLTAEFNYHRLKTGTFINIYTNNHHALNSEFFLAFGVLKGKTYSFYLKALGGMGRYLNGNDHNNYYTTDYGGGIKNEWNIGPGKITFDIDFVIHEDYGKEWQVDDQMGGFLGFKLGYLFYF